MVPGAGIEPARCCHRGIFLPATVFTASKNAVCGLDFLFTVFAFANVGGCRQVSTRSRFNSGFARDCHQHYLKGFPEFDTIHTGYF